MRTTGKSGRLKAVIVILIFLIYSTQKGHCDDDVASSCVKLDANVTREHSACSTIGHVRDDSHDTNTARNYFITIVDFIYIKKSKASLPTSSKQPTLAYEERSREMIDGFTSEEVFDDIASSVKHMAHNMLGDVLNQDFKLNVDKLLSYFLPAEEDATVQPEGGEVVFEYPKMEQIKPVKVGHEQSVDIGDETSYPLVQSFSGQKRIPRCGKYSYHGGCNVKKRVKWIGLHLVQTPHYRHRFLSSKFAIRFADVY
ncbi:hypothetical protein DPMN_065500 [Dreissena polymorpha]|uniref:Uncharacterized protein n=1 Tax=Dreissena polymorpha TaxID=45954 RepID=A0A9D3YW35_DREPO|nr:hypothetical protein DPMN_065500 [Dreissena polymorpha]